MSEQKEPFLPEQVDEQIDMLTQPARPLTPPARLISNLRAIQQEDHESVARVRARLDSQLAGRHLSAPQGHDTLYGPRLPMKRSQSMQTPSPESLRTTDGPPTQPGWPENPEYWERSSHSGIIERRPEQPRRPRRLLLPALIAAALIIAALSGGTTFWLLHRPQAPVYPLAASPTPTPGRPPIPKPASDIPGSASGLYITTLTSVARIDLQSGQTYWQMPASFSAQPVVIDKVVIISSTPAAGSTADPFIAGLDAGSGQVLWRLKAQATYLLGSPTGLVYASGCDSFPPHSCAIRALNAATGRQLWSYRTQEGTAWIALSSDNVLYGATPTHLFEVSATGQQVWQTSPQGLDPSAPEQITSAPVISKNAIYVTTCAGLGSTKVPSCSLTAFDASNSAQNWRVMLLGEAEASPIVADTTVYVGTADGHILTVDTSRGTNPVNMLSTYQLAGQITKPLVFIDGLLFVATRDNPKATQTYLTAIDTGNWHVRWSQDLGTIYGTGPDWQTMIGLKDELFTVEGANTINALKSSDGNTIQSYPLPSTSQIIEFTLIP